MFRLPDNHIIINQFFYDVLWAKCTSQDSFAYLFSGPAGTGKTELMKIVANYLLVKPVTTSELWLDYFRIICSSVTDKNDALERRVNRFKERDLFLDDIGAEITISDKASGFVAAGITSMCDRIVANKEAGRSYTNIITTNLTAKEIQEVYGQRVYDRLFQAFEIVQFKKILKDKKGNLISFREKQTEVVKL